MTVGVGSDAVGAVRINAALDGLAWFLARSEPSDTTLHIVLGAAMPDGSEPAMKEHLGAIATLVATLRIGPQVRVWTLAPDGDPIEMTVDPPTFTTPTPLRWNNLLLAAAAAPVTGMAAELVAAVRHPSFALYPKLTSLTSLQPWQMRIDGLEIGRTGADGTTLGLNSKNYDAPKEPRDTWRNVVRQQSTQYERADLAKLVGRIDGLITAWSDPDRPDAALHHGHPEHALEAHVLSGRLPLSTPDGPLGLAVPFRSGMLGAAQFPTLWGDVSGPPRYLDALLTDSAGHPWAVELKDQEAGGGHGKYLRHGIGQAVLYRHFIRTAEQLDPWFAHYNLERINCRAALAFPTAKTGTSMTIERLRDLARRFDVEVIEFARPGGDSP